LLKKPKFVAVGEGIRFAEAEREAEALERARRGGNFQPAAELLEDRGLSLFAEWARDGMKVDRRRRASQDRSKVHQAALELPAIQRILREHCGDGSLKRAISFACRRYDIEEKDTLENHLRSRHHPRRFKKRGRPPK